MKLDANLGFHLFRLTRDSKEPTTFITPVGCYSFTRLPFGIIAAPEHFQRRITEILDGIPGVVNLMDDVLAYRDTKEQHEWRLTNVPPRLVKDVTLIKAKCAFTVSEISRVDHLLSKDDIQPDPSRWLM